MAAIVAAPRATRAARQIGLCPWCGKPLGNPLDGDATHIDHVDPLNNPTGLHSTNGAVRRSHYDTRRGFAEHGDNLRLLHADCNNDRGNPPQLTEVPF